MDRPALLLRRTGCTMPTRYCLGTFGLCDCSRRRWHLLCLHRVLTRGEFLNQMNCDDYVQEIASGAALNCHTVQSFLHDSGQRQWTKGAIQLYLDIVNLFLCDCENQ